MDSVLNCMVSDRLAGGDYPDRLVKAARERFGFDHAVALRSPLIALDTALGCCALAPGDGLALSALADAWLMRAIEQRGLRPVWLDVDPASGCIGADSPARMAAGGAKALFLDAPWGILPDPALIADAGIPIIEDASTSLGATAGDLKAGMLGTFSIIGIEHAAAFTGGCGALLCAPKRREAQVLRNATEGLSRLEMLPDINAALALSQLRDLDRFLEKRRGLMELYQQSLARFHRKSLAQTVEGTASCFGCVVVVETGVKDVRAYARKKDVDTLMAFDDSCMVAGLVPAGSAPQATSLANRAIAFPLHPRIGKTAAQKIAKVLATLP
jgi:dTDP-4-amino-4,6-dideoxygalactose transaminase